MSDLLKSLSDFSQGRYVPGALVMAVGYPAEEKKPITIPFIGDRDGSVIRFAHGDLLIVISHKIQADGFACEVETFTYVLHNRLQRLIFFTDIEKAKWLQVIG